ncbi:hypothetical protein [Kordiimonas laminariae]|uniref:hypothetical protein n=1 Tax=Kordiimonas laminariae TaxID=2917717 RepID=UPI001FF6D362|nr:hypothetical protein [Kordiimonas laminariae]MCK0069288.1 hypothetical protein [Kordiimonas laminariae]
MRNLLRILILTGFLSVGFSSAQAQSGLNETDPRQMSLDLYAGINRGVLPENLALQLRDIIQLFRYRCTRVTDYQVFQQRPNLIDLKVKCSGDPLYGVTVASNGFVSVFGGNGILSGFDRRDGLILSFRVEGETTDSSLTVDQAFDETVSRIEMGDEFDYIYLLSTFMMILGIGIVVFVVWLKMYRFKQGRKPRQRHKPMQKHRVRLSSKVKDQLLEESTEVAKYVHRHPSGVYLSVGKTGKRRLFRSRFWAVIYARFGMKMFETSLEEAAAEEEPAS